MELVPLQDRSRKLQYQQEESYPWGKQAPY